MCALEKPSPKRAKQQDQESSDEYPVTSDKGQQQQEDQQDEQQDKLEPVDINDTDASVLAAELDDDDTELWLISVPRHDSVRATLPGSKLRFPKRKSTNCESHNKSIGVLRGSYVYREHDPPQNGNVRALFVVKEESAKPTLRIAKPFSKAISVAFDTEMRHDDHIVPLKRYLEMPQDLRQKYFPIGSKKRKFET